MTSSGRRWAFIVGALLALSLPKRVPCGFPSGSCSHLGARGAWCTPYEVEPWGFYLVELVVGRDVGFAYSSGEDCR
jgi:hypothetical protein